MEYHPENKRQSDGYCCFEIFRRIIKGIPINEREDYVLEFINLVDEYEFYPRKETDPILHPNSKNDLWKNISTMENPKTLLQIIFQPMLERGYNASRAKTMKKVFLGELKKYFFENMPFEYEGFF